MRARRRDPQGTARAIDGRTTTQIRPDRIDRRLPARRTHGSSLFTRGETQAICTTALGTKDAEQMIDGLDGLLVSALHAARYNFPPYSVGEVGRFGAPGRRRSSAAMASSPGARSTPFCPPRTRFPIRSACCPTSPSPNGSSSTATCSAAACLSTMDAGVRIRTSGFGHRDGSDPEVGRRDFAGAGLTFLVTRN